MRDLLKENILHCREEKNLHYSRNALGIESLYYTLTSEGYKFASDIGQLLSLPSVT